eukprot:s3226_g9.t1
MVLRGQTLRSDEIIRSSDGDSFDVLVERQILPVQWMPPFRPHRPGAEGLNLMQTEMNLLPRRKDNRIEDSLTDEFIEAVRAAEQAAEHTPTIEDPDAIETQSEFVQELWEYWQDHATREEIFNEPAVRVETWFVHHLQNDRCYHPRIVILSSDFRSWEATLIAAWSDRAIVDQEAFFALVYPTPEDIANNAIMQIVIVQRMDAERRSIVLSVYDTDPDVDPIRTFCITVASQISHYGMLLGFNCKKALGYVSSADGHVQEISFKPEYISVIAKDPRALIVRVRTPVLKCIFIAAHAPHTGTTEADIAKRWHDLQKLVPAKYKGWDKILLADANARMDSLPSEAVGTWQAEEDSDKSGPFLEFLHQQSMWLPATFEAYQKGPGGTWLHNAGKWLRNDFIGIPQNWAYSVIEAYISTDIDVSTVKEDHAVAVVSIKAAGSPVAQRHTKKMIKRTETDLRPELGSWLAQPLPIDWSVDVHTHADAIQAHVLNCIPHKKTARKPLKHIMTSHTWDRVVEKKFWRNHWESNGAQKRLWLRCCFDAWKGRYDEDFRQEISKLNRQHDFLIATAYDQFRKLGIRQRRQANPPMRPEHLEEQWHPYFQELEVGTFIESKQLVADCHAYQISRSCEVRHCKLTDFPSRAQIVEAFRAAQPHKATGLDPLPAGLLHQFPVQMASLCFDLFLKVFAWQSEPIQGKGGILAVIPKKQDHTRASHFRGIMLLPSVFKRLHALLRERVIVVIAPIKPAGQIGGFAGWATGSLAMFESNSQIANKDDVNEVIDNLQRAGGNVVGVRKWLEFPCLLQRMGAPDLLVRLLQDAHAHTWHVLSAHPGLTKTRRGTRPGSSLADVIFHVAMLDVTLELNTWISNQQTFAALLQRLNIEIEAIVWSDDMVVPWLTEQAHELPSAIQTLLAKIHQIFLRRGFDLNMQKGKTTAVITFRGEGAPGLRREFQLSSPSGMHCKLTTGSSCWLHIVPAYTHLGTYLATDGGFDVELQSRIGQAMSAFSVLAKPVLCNKHINLHVRLRLFHALVGNRLFFGLGSWPTPSQRQMVKLNAALVKCLRRILGVAYQGGDVRTTDAQVFAWARCPDARVRLAQDRLLLAQKLFMRGPTFIHHMLHQEYSCSDHSWLHGVFADLRWLHKLDPAAVPVSWTPSLTEPIDYWQQGGYGWKSIIRRLGRKHVYQEMMMMEVHTWHQNIFQTLESAGAEFRPRPFTHAPVGDQASYPCFCGRTFSTSVGLATHQRKQHMIVSSEHDLLAGATCPACMKHFWTTQRLQQHLAYVSRRTGRNDCFQTLKKTGFVAEYERVSMKEWAGRLDCRG